MGRTYSCLKDRIGLRTVSTTTPDSGMYLEQLPGVELKMLNDIADVQQKNYVQVWDDIQERAIRQFQLDTISEFKKKYKLKTITQSVDAGRAIDTSTTTAPGANYQGYTLELNREDHSFVDSNLQAIFVRNIQFYSDFAGSVDVKIFDLDLDVELFTNTFTAAVGWNTVTVEETFIARRLFLCYDATNITAVEYDITKLQNAVNSDCASCDFAYYDYWDDINCGIEIRGATATIADPYTVTFGTDTFGASGVFAVHCTFENIICNNMAQFDNALLYLLGIHLMQERRYSDRVNKWTVFDRNKAAELETLYHVYYNGGMIVQNDNEMKIEGYLRQAIDGIELSQADCCVECNQFIRHMGMKI